MISIRQSPPSDAELIQWSLDNPGVRFEYVNGVVTVSPTTGKSGVRTSLLNIKLGVWAKSHGYTSFGSSTLFHFDELQVSPDEVLILSERFNVLSDEEQDETVTLVPDVAVEIISKSRGFGKTRGGVLPKCNAMYDSKVGYVLMLDPYATGSDRFVAWGCPPPNFPTDWDDILNA